MAGINPNSLNALFMPRSVAIVGASSDSRRFGGRPVQYLIESGFPGAIYPVNPNRDEIQGIKAWPSLRAIEGQIDCAILATSAQDTLSAIEDCVAIGVKAAILYGAGFAEAGDEGVALQNRIIDTARKSGLRLLGPNCMGVLNSHSGFYGTFASAMEESIPAPGNIAVASQSGGYGGHLMKHLFLRGLGVSQWITTGNEADIDVGEALHWMAGRDENKVILLYLEGLRSRDKLIAGLERARRNNKPVIVMKVGRTTAGSAAAASHTASLTGEDSVYDAVFEAYGVYRARTTEELLDVAYALSKGVKPLGPRVGVISISGGIGVQIADFVSDAGLEMGVVPEATQAALRQLVPHCSPHNPIDMTGLVTTNHDIMEKTLDAVFASNAFDATLVFLGISGSAPSMARPLQQAIANACARAPEQLMFVSITSSDEMVREYDQKGFLVFEDPSRAIRALHALHHFAQLEASTFADPVPAPAAAPLGLVPGSTLNEAEGKALLAAHGIRSPREAVAANADDAAMLAGEIGLPVAIKVVSPDILHKTEYGGVALSLGTQEAVRDAVARMETTIPSLLPDARIEGYLVAEMVTDGVECIVGTHTDETFGPVITFGLGGTLVELIKDTACALAPLSLAQAETLIRQIKTFPLLDGYRGGPQYDVAALAQAIVDLSMFAASHAGEIAGIEVNPLLVRPRGKGVVALDAVIQVADGQQAP